MRPLKAFGSPVLDLCMPKPFLVHQGMFDPSFPHGWWYYVRSCDVAELNDDIIDIVAEYGRRIVSPITSVALWQMGGAVARVGESETAFNGRKCRFHLQHQRQQRVRRGIRGGTRSGPATTGPRWRPTTPAST